MSSYPVVKLPFLGCKLTAYTDITPVLDVTEFAEFLRDPEGYCAFCHGDPCAERPCPDCRGGYIKTQPAGSVPLGGLPVRTFKNAKWFFQHVPHDENCTRVTWIDREFAATPDYSFFETCPCCEGRPT